MPKVRVEFENDGLMEGYFFEQRVHVAGRNGGIPFVGYGDITMRREEIPPGFLAILDCEGDIVMLVPEEAANDWAATLNNWREWQILGGEE